MDRNVRIALGALLLTLAAYLACPPLRAAEERPAIMPVSEIRAGMEGYGLSTFVDGPPGRFQFKVLSVVNGWWPKGEMILIEMEGPVVDKAGIIAGMSGSPVYIDGKLIGAVAYGWSFVKTPLAGVQPIEQMLTVAKIGRDAAARDRADAKARARGVLKQRRAEVVELLRTGSRTERDDDALRVARLRTLLPTGPPERAATEPDDIPPRIADLLPRDAQSHLRPLPLAVNVRGMKGRIPELFTPLRDAGLLPVQAGGGGVAPVEGSRLRPGAPVAVVYVTGDMDISASGTVTWMHGDEMLAFGHPMDESGEANYPIAQAKVDTVVPSAWSSFRITSAGKVVGRLKQDRSSAVWCKMGEQAPMFPCHVKFKGVVSDEYNYRVAGHWETAATWAFYASALSALRWEPYYQPAQLKGRAEIAIQGRREPLILENEYAADSPVWTFFELIADPLSELMYNEFEDVKIAGLKVEIEMMEDVEFATIESATPDRLRAAPGEEIALRVRLRRYHGRRAFRGEEAVETLKLRVPDTARPGTRAELFVCDASTSRMIDYSIDPGLYEPKDLDALVERLGQMDSNRNLILRASFTDGGLRYDGAAMPALPPSAMRLLTTGESRSLSQPLIRDVKTTGRTPWVLTGAASARIDIVNPRRQR